MTRPPHPTKNRALWTITLSIGAFLFVIAGFWMSAAYQIADRWGGIYENAAGWRRAYLLVASLVGSYVVVRLLPVAASRLKVVARGHDRMSGSIEMAGMIPLLCIAGLAIGLAAGAVWPVAIPVMVHQHRKLTAQKSLFEQEEVRKLRHGISSASRE